MPSLFEKQPKLGILGGGQLGRMLIQSAINFDLYTKVLDGDGQCPCRDVCSEFVRGSITDYETVLRFGRGVDVLTIEIENVNVDALEQLQSDGITVHPQPHVIRTIQDKGRQKQFLLEHNIPTTEFQIIENKTELLQFDRFFPAVQKLRTTGYDGRGIYKITGKQDFGKAFEKPSVLEKFVEFEKEISVIVARNISGEMKTYPPVEMMFHPEANLVEFLIAPASLSPSVEHRAEAIACDVARALNIIGLAAVEMFVMHDGTIFVNEIAPRPHNSGHHTIEANVTSQYDQHLRAIFDLPLGSTVLQSPAVMVNILGTEGFEGAALYQGIEKILAIDGATVHLYGKAITKPFRKMGHVTILDSNIDSALQKALYIKQQLKVIA